MFSGNENGKIKTMDRIFSTSLRINPKRKCQGTICNINHHRVNSSPVSEDRLKTSRSIFRLNEYMVLMEDRKLNSLHPAPY